MRLSLGGGARSKVDLQFVRPTPQTLVESLVEIPHLRIWVGEECLSAWDKTQYEITFRVSVPNIVRVEFGHEAARARVTVWRNRLRRSHSGLAVRDVAGLLEEAFSQNDVSLIEVDADNLGVIRIVPSLISAAVGTAALRIDRLAWRDQLLARLVPPNGTKVSAVAVHPRSPFRRVVRPVDAAALVRSRVTLRGRNGQGDRRQ